MRWPGRRKAPRPPRTRSLRHGAPTLPKVVVFCLLASAAVRLASGTGQALAQGVSGLIPALAPAGHVLEAAQEPAFSCPADAELDPILARIMEREESLSETGKALAAREAALASVEARIHKRLEDLRTAEERLAATMARTAVAAESDVAALVTVYESMKPKDAAPVFEAMAPEFAAGFLIRMRPDAAAAILAGVAPERAYAISAILAGRNADVPVPSGGGDAR